MPSYIIHYICGKKLIENYRVTDKKQALFLIGNLIPDTSKIQTKKERYLIQGEKNKTHFRDGMDKDKVMLPYPEKFKKKYDIHNSFYLGYYYHLYTDKYFLSEIFNNSLEFLTSDLRKTDSNKKSKYIRLKKNNKIILKEEFFSQSYLYHDYTIMNKLLLNYYGIQFDESELRKYINLINSDIEEVDIINLESIILDTLSYIKESQNIKEDNLEVFDKNLIIRFINELNNKFVDENKQILKKVGFR